MNIYAAFFSCKNCSLFCCTKIALDFTDSGYHSSATDAGEIYLVEKISGRSYAELAPIVHEQIANGSAIKLNFQWLQSSDFISVLCDCDGINPRGYYLVIKGVSDNTHPVVKFIKVLGG